MWLAVKLKGGGSDAEAWVGMREYNQNLFDKKKRMA